MARPLDIGAELDRGGADRPEIARHNGHLGPETASRSGRRGFDQERASAAIRELLIAIGEDPDREGLRDTPARAARAFGEMTAGLRGDPAEPLRTVFTEHFHGLVMVRDIELQSLCEHHLLPFFGHVDVAYLPPPGRITGLSKLARAVDTVARRPQVQERLTDQLADTIMNTLEADGVFVVVEAEHLCMSLRGVRKRGSRTVTATSRGALFKPDAPYDALLRLLQTPS
jgi:GTP cyclohydrolase I